MAIEINFKSNFCFSYNQHLNNVPFIDEIVVKNNNGEDVVPSSLVLYTKPCFLKVYKIEIPALSAGGVFVIKNFSFDYEIEMLANFNEAVEGILCYEYSQDEKVLYKNEFKVDLRPYDEGSNYLSHAPLRAAFVTPNHPQINELISKISDKKGEQKDSYSIVGYSWGQEEILKTAECMFEVIKEQEIAYVISKRGFHMSHQRIRLVDEILTSKQANCLDMSYLFASVLEALGLNPIIAITKSHAFAGFWLNDKDLQQSVIKAKDFLRKHTNSEQKEIVMFECTDATKGAKNTFEDACNDVYEIINREEDSVEYVVDIKSARKEGIVPLPARISGTTIHIVNEENGKEPSKLKFEYPQISEETIGFEETKFENNEPQALKKIERWKNKLLDISASSALMNIGFRAEGTGVAMIYSADGKIVYQKVKSGKKFVAMGYPNDCNIIQDSLDLQDIASGACECEELLENDLNQNLLHLSYEESAVKKMLAALKRADKTHKEQNGAGILYMTFGAMRWVEERSGKVCYAPVLLVPAVIEKVGSHMQISYDGTEIFFNAAILEMLKKRFDLRPTGLNPLPLGEDGHPDFDMILQRLQKACREETNLAVFDHVCLDLFAFSQYLMWNDLKQYETFFKNHPLVKSIIDGNKTEEVNAIIEEIDEERVLLPLPADASQIKAIQKALSNESFVLHGPPGTGKSQTITAMLANFLGSGKSVLFAAEKAPALQVVYNRMKASGLEDFCIYLPANLTRKSDTERFLAQYAHLMEIAEDVSTEYEELKCSIDAELAKINALLDIFRLEDYKGYSLANLLSECLKYPDVIEKTKAMDQSILTCLENGEYDSLYRMLKDTMYMGSLAGDMKDHPLKKWENIRYEYGMQKKMREYSQMYLELLQRIKELDDKILQEDTLDLAGKEYSDKNLAEKYIAIERVSCIPENLRNEENLPEKLRTWIRYQEVLPIRELFYEKVTPEFIELDIERVKAKWERICHKTSSLAKLERLEMKDEFSKYIVKKGFTDRDFTDIIEMAVKVRDINKEVPMFLENSMNLTREQAVELERAVEFSYPYGLPKFLGNITKEDEELAKEGLKLLKEHEKLCKEMRDIFGAGTPCWNPKDSLEKILDEVAHWTDGLDSIREWCDYQFLKEDCEKHGLQGWIDLYESGMNTEEVLQNFASACSLLMLKKMFDEHKEIREFAGYRFDNIVRKYQEFMEQYFEVCAREIRCRKLHEIAELLKNPEYSSEKVILKKLIESAGKGYTIRGIINKIGSYLMKLTSCIMATPMSVAMYFAPDAITFDHVVMDEASQIQTCKAVGLLVRSKNAIVVGDPNQMPPTSFFESSATDENIDALEEDQESILKDFIALDMPDYYLKWHYRSNHESLITYSNYKYYGGRMITFPSKNQKQSKVHVVRTNGIYDRGNSMTNRIEAEQLVAYLEQQLISGDTRSYGIVTFNKRQQLLIERLIDKQYDEKAEMKKAMDAMAEKGEELFVRNLESVQGDERDVILFTIGFGPDQEGKILMSFGPLAKAGGWRRLNVAITRARDEMVLFTSMDSDQMTINSSTSRGVCDLKDFIAYAENAGMDFCDTLGMEESETAYTASFETDGLADEICSYLEKLGYCYERNVGNSLLKIDVAVVNPTEKEKYLLGIVLNSKAGKGEFSVYDSEVGQMSIMKKQGWNLLRLWTLDWLEDSEREQKRIFDAIKDACDE